MTRLKIDLPERFHFSSDIPIRLRDVNLAAHLDLSCVLTYTLEAKQSFLRQCGISSPQDLGGAGFIVADAVIVFKKEAFYGQTLTVQLAIGDLTRKGCSMFYRLADKATGAEVARVKTSLVFFDYETRKSVPVPERFKQIVADCSPGTMWQEPDAKRESPG